MIADSVAFLKEHGREVVLDAEHFFDGYRANRAYALAVLGAAADAGADWLTLCDTNGGSLPGQIEEAVAEVVEKFDAGVGIHAHNDGELAVANSLAAVTAGARQVQGTINGYGERIGNANLCSVIPNLALKLGYSCTAQEHLSELSQVSRFFDDLADMASNPRLPFVGDAAFAHKGGIHVQAVALDPSTYEHVDPARRWQRAAHPRQRAERAQQRDRAGATARARARPREPGRARRRSQDQGARERGLPVRGRRGVVRAARPPHSRPLRASVRATRLRRRRAEGRRRGSVPVDGDRGSRGRRRGASRRGNRRRPGRRARKGHAPRSAACVPAPRRRLADGLPIADRASA